MDPVEKKIINDYLNRAIHLDIGEKLDARSLILLLRRRLSLSQERLAELSGISHSTIMRIESGKGEPNLETIKQLLNAMECDMILLPIPQRLPDQILRERAERIAKKRTRYLQGTMAMENQEPDEKWLKELFERDVEELLRTPTKLWADDAD